MEKYWIATRCPHWSKEQNKRFRLVRIDGEMNHVGRYPSAVWDADRKLWLDQARMGGTSGHELAHPAAPKDLTGVSP